MSTRHFSFCSSPYLVYFSFISVPPIFTIIASTKCLSTIQNGSLSLSIFLWGWGYLVYFSFISVPPIFTSVACSECWSTIQNVSLSLGIFLWGGTWWGAGLACSWALTGGACPRGGQSQSLALGHWGIHSCGGWGGGTWWGTGLAEHLITT